MVRFAPFPDGLWYDESATGDEYKMEMTRSLWYDNADTEDDNVDAIEMMPVMVMIVIMRWYQALSSPCCRGTTQPWTDADDDGIFSSFPWETNVSEM